MTETLPPPGADLLRLHLASLCLACIPTVSQREGQQTGPPVLPGCSGSAASSCTLNWGWSCCSACWLHAHRLSPTPPGMWISVRYTNIENRAVSHTAAHAGGALLHVIKNKGEKTPVGRGNKWVSHKHTWVDTHDTNKNTIQGLGLIQCCSEHGGRPTQLHILPRWWQVWLQHQLSYVNSLVGVLCGTLIKPGQQITLYHSASLPQIAI